MKVAGKVVSKVVGVVLLLLSAGYLLVSWPKPTIDRASNPTDVNNLHLIDADPSTGYAIYRLGQPNEGDVRGLCKLGVTEIVVLAGTALNYERAYLEACPSLEVIYNVEDDLAPLTVGWLVHFDDWVSEAKAGGKKVAFRCTCGCHRTGRLAAYYQMKHRGFNPKDAWDLALTRGSIMEAVDYFSGLQQQIIALYEHIHALPCSQGEFCVVQEAPDQQPCANPLMGCGWKSASL